MKYNNNYLCVLHVNVMMLFLMRWGQNIHIFTTYLDNIYVYFGIFAHSWLIRCARYTMMKEYGGRQNYSLLFTYFYCFKTLALLPNILHIIVSCFSRKNSQQLQLL